MLVAPNLLLFTDVCGGGQGTVGFLEGGGDSRLVHCRIFWLCFLPGVGGGVVVISFNVGLGGGGGFDSSIFWWGGSCHIQGGLAGLWGSTLFGIGGRVVPGGGGGQGSTLVVQGSTFGGLGSILVDIGGQDNTFMDRGFGGVSISLGALLLVPMACSGPPCCSSLDLVPRHVLIVLYSFLVITSHSRTLRVSSSSSESSSCCGPCPGSC